MGVVTVADQMDIATCYLGYACKKGHKPGSPNQDAFSVLRVGDRYSVYGVYDGNGPKGHDVSQFVKENLQKLIIKDSRFRTPEMTEMVKDSYIKTQKLLAK